MATASRPRLNAHEWTTIRDAREGSAGYEYPRYEAKLVEDHGKAYVESELVLLKETRPNTNSEHVHQLPKEVFRGVVAELP